MKEDFVLNVEILKRFITILENVKRVLNGSKYYLIGEPTMTDKQRCTVGDNVMHNCSELLGMMCVHPKNTVTSNHVHGREPFTTRSIQPQYMTNPERAADLTWTANNLIEIIRQDHHYLQYQDAKQIIERLNQLAEEMSKFHEAVLRKGL